MKVINKINDDLIEIREYAKPNACFHTNEYPDSYDFVVLREIFNPFDLFNDNKIKDMEIERLNNIINKKEQFLRDNIKRLEREVVKRDNIINELVNDNNELCKENEQLKSQLQHHKKKQENI